MSSGWRVVVTIAIKGADEDDHHVLLSELPEIESYQRLITETARASSWRITLSASESFAGSSRHSRWASRP